MYGNVIAEPPVDAANQPVNTKPERVGADGSESDSPDTVEPSDTELPPCELYVTVSELPVHCAYNVKLAV